ncbi:lipopolysaccharide biosynthesis protein [Paraburkholderia youngii]|uniref:lipopolysaccharide biosynthesis protein n=1 Tax=Paraburkholderia youngii TaxID=2782701 RepID=UPI003D1E14C4
MLRSKRPTIINPRDSLVSLCGVVTGQVAMFLSVYLLGHWQGPGALGQFNYWLAIGAFTASVLGFRYELACVDHQPADSFNAFINASFLASVVTLVALTLTCLFDHPEYYAVTLFSLASFIQMAASLYYNSLRWYGKIALSRAATNGLFAAFLLFDHFRLRSNSSDPFAWYVWITSGVALVMVIGILVSGRRAGFSFKISKRFYVDNRRFALYILPSTVCGSILSSALAIVIPRWYGAESAGYFAAAYRLGFFPVSLIGQSLGGVFRRDAIAAMSEDGDGRGLPHVYAAYARTLTALSVFYVIGGGLLFAPMVTLTFGTGWQQTIAFFYRLLPWFALEIIFLPLAQVFLAVKAQRTDFLFQLMSCLGLLATLYLTRVAGLAVQESIQIISLSGTVLTAVGIAVTYRATHGSTTLSGKEA